MFSHPSRIIYVVTITTATLNAMAFGVATESRKTLAHWDSRASTVDATPLISLRLLWFEFPCLRCFQAVFYSKLLVFSL